MFKVKNLSPLINRCSKFINNVNNSTIKLKYSNHLKNTQEEVDQAPIKYSTSKAFKYKAKTSRTGVEYERLWYEPYVVTISMLTFLMYFCILREENDIDKGFSKNLKSTLEKLKSQINNE